MPPILALLVCVIFVSILLRIEHRQNPAASLALWLPTIWILIAASRPLSSWFGVYGEDMESGSPLDRVILLIFLFAALAILARRQFNWVAAFQDNAWLMLIIVYGFFSICWSEIPFISLKRWTRDAIVVPMAFVVLSERWPRLALQSIFRRTVYILIPFSALLVKYYPSYGANFNWSGERNWIGVAMQKNGLGRLCLFAIIFLIWTLIRRWKKRDIPVVQYQTYIEVLLLLITLWLLKGPPGSYPATAIGTLVLGLAVLVGLLSLKKYQAQLSVGVSAVIAALIVIGTITPFVGGKTMGPFVSVLGRDETVTGRTDIWELLVKEVWNSPILGHGVGGFWTTDRVEKTLGVKEAHNGYLDVLLHYGFVGIVLFGVFLLSCCWRARGELTFDYDWGALWMCFLFIAALHNFSESSIQFVSNHLTAVLVFLTVCSTRAAAVSSYSGLLNYPNNFPANYRALN